MSEEINQVFEALFFNSPGIFIGLPLFFSLCIGLVMKWKYIGALLIPLIIGLEVEYFNRLTIEGNHIWSMISLVILAFLIAYETIKPHKSK